MTDTEGDNKKYALVNIDLSKLSETAKCLIEKISGVIGTLYEPVRIRKRADAEAQAAIIAAEANNKVSEIQQRGLARLVYEEGRKHENIESITYRAAIDLDDSANPTEMDEDWVSFFFNNCNSVSNEEMQSFWAKILKGEAQKPGSISKKTVQVASALSKESANLFTSLCTFCLGDYQQYPIILDYSAEIYRSKGIWFVSLKTLEELGLIHFDSNIVALTFDGNRIPLNYFHIALTFTVNPAGRNTIQQGYVTLTEAGRQLAPLCGALADPQFVSYLIKEYGKLSIDVRINK